MSTYSSDHKDALLFAVKAGVIDTPRDEAVPLCSEFFDSLPISSNHRWPVRDGACCMICGEHPKRYDDRMMKAVIAIMRKVKA